MIADCQHCNKKEVFVSDQLAEIGLHLCKSCFKRYLLEFVMPTEKSQEELDKIYESTRCIVCDRSAKETTIMAKEVNGKRNYFCWDCINKLDLKGK